MAKLVAEIRNLNRAISDHLAKVQIGDLAAPKSPQHRAAAVAVGAAPAHRGARRGAGGTVSRGSGRPRQLGVRPQ